MKQTISLKLEPTSEQYQSLLRTMEAFNRGCQYVADVAYEKRIANKVRIQPIVYSELRTRFGLSSQMAVRAISKAIEAYKRDKRIHCRFDLHGAMVYDQRIMSFKGLTHVSLLTLTGRERIPIRFGAYQAARMDRIQGQADLVLRNGVFYLYVTVDIPTPPPIEP
jgi:predicted transposase